MSRNSPSPLRFHARTTRSASVCAIAFFDMRADSGRIGFQPFPSGRIPRSGDSPSRDGLGVRATRVRRLDDRRHSPTFLARSRPRRPSPRLEKRLHRPDRTLPTPRPHPRDAPPFLATSRAPARPARSPRPAAAAVAAARLASSRAPSHPPSAAPSTTDYKARARESSHSTHRPFARRARRVCTYASIRFLGRARLSPRSIASWPVSRDVTASPRTTLDEEKTIR